VIRSVADPATEDLFNGVESRSARTACPIALPPVVRRKHTGNVFEKVLYETDCKPEGRCWLPLDALRRPREAAIAKRVRAVARRGAREA